MTPITYTFPSDFPHETLQGLTVTGGKAVIRGGATISGDFQVCEREMEVGIEFKSGPDGKPFSISVRRYPELRTLVREQVLADFGVSETHGVERTTDYVVSDTGQPIQFGRITESGAHARCSKAAAIGSVSGHLRVFAVVQHPQFGYIGVTPLEFAVLELPEIEGWEFLA